MVNVQHVLVDLHVDVDDDWSFKKSFVGRVGVDDRGVLGFQGGFYFRIRPSVERDLARALKTGLLNEGERYKNTGVALPWVFFC